MFVLRWLSWLIRKLIMSEPRIAAATAIAVNSRKPFSQSVQEAMERAVLQAIQYGVQDDPEKLSAMIKEARILEYQKANEILNVLRAEVDSSEDHPHIRQAMHMSIDGCVKAGINDEHDIRGSMLLARERALRSL